MEEFIENFQEFRAWLFELPAVTTSDADLLDKIRTKFTSLGLNDAF